MIFNLVLLSLSLLFASYAQAEPIEVLNCTLQDQYNSKFELRRYTPTQGESEFVFYDYENDHHHSCYRNTSSLFKNNGSTYLVCVDYTFSYSESHKIVSLRPAKDGGIINEGGEDLLFSCNK
jgi:hypothetical protein